MVPVAVGSLGLLLLFGLIKLLQPPEKLPPLKLATTPPPSSVVETDLRTAIDKQVLARPDSKLFADSKGDLALDRKPGNFERFFVFGSENGWIEVGDTQTSTIGWMKEDDTVDWPHSIVVEYGSPENRLPVLYFKKQEDLTDLLNAGDRRGEIVRKLYEDTENAAREGSPLPSTHPVVCVEPSQNDRELSITPVLEAKMADISGQAVRVLRVTAAGMERGATSLDNPEYVKLLQQNREISERSKPQVLEGIDLDVVFVVDMTGTMQPWVDGLFSAISDVAKGIEGNPKVSGRVRFGLWGYQDNPGYSGIEFHTKCFTPSLVEAGDFSTILREVKVNKPTPDSYPEDVFAGVTDALTQTEWRSANKLVVVIGDAPGHTTIQSGGAKDIDAVQVRQIATDADIDIVALAIKDGSSAYYQKHHPLLESQFQILATNGNRPPAYLSVTDSGQTAFKDMMTKLVGELAEQKSLSRESAEPLMPVSEGAESGLNIARGLLESAKVRVVSEVVNTEGKTVVPRDINGWVVDRDLLNPGVVSLEPKLLVTRTDLNKLLIMAEGLIRNAEDAKIVGGDFHDAVLKAVAGSASNNRTENLKDRLPDFIKGLPYRSEFMEKSKDWWASASQEDQDRFIAEMKAKLSYYRTVNENPALWKPLSREAASGDYMAAIPLSQLL